MQLQRERSDPWGGFRQANEVQEDKVQPCPQAAKRQSLGTALHELSCSASELSRDGYRAIVLDVLA